MRIVEASVKKIETKGKSPYQIVELAGRTCYKSTDKICDGSAEKFIRNIVDRKHYAMLEHGIVHFTGDFKELIQMWIDCDAPANVFKYVNYSYLGIVDDLSDEEKQQASVMSGSLRAWLELMVAGWLTNDIEKQLVDAYPEVFKGAYEQMVEKYCLNNKQIDELKDEDYTLRITSFEDVYDTYNRMYARANNRDKEEINKQFMQHSYHTLSFTCDRGITHELVRHRPCSFAQESTRYCNYSNDKFDNQITVIRPLFFEHGTVAWKLWYRAMECVEQTYMELLDTVKNPDVDDSVKVVAQEARSVLPNSLKAEIILTCNETEWQHILDLRYHGKTGAPHPQMIEVMNLAYPLLTADSENRLK